MITIELPWPDKRLNPNDGAHWKAKITPKREAKEYAYYMTLSHILNCDFTPPEQVEITYTFYPPDKRRRDLDNLLSSLKHAQDGVFKAIKADDSSIQRTVVEWGEPCKPGKVVLTLEELDD